MKFEYTSTYQLDGKYMNARLHDHDITEARAAMEAHKVDNRGTGCVNYWIIAAHKAP